jgi:hypothetical protein
MNLMNEFNEFNEFNEVVTALLRTGAPSALGHQLCSTVKKSGKRSRLIETCGPEEAFLGCLVQICTASKPLIGSQGQSLDEGRSEALHSGIPYHVAHQVAELLNPGDHITCQPIETLPKPEINSMDHATVS